MTSLEDAETNAFSWERHPGIELRDCQIANPAADSGVLGHVDLTAGTRMSRHLSYARVEIGVFAVSATLKVHALQSSETFKKQCLKIIPLRAT